MKIREKIMIPVSLCYLVAITLIYFGCKIALSKYGYGSELNRILFLQVIVVGVVFGLFLLYVEFAVEFFFRFFECAQSIL